MMYRKSIFTALAVAMLCSCGGSSNSGEWQNATVVATRTVINGEDFITFDPSLLKDTIVFPISHFMEEINFVKLDDADDALVYPAAVVISDNYILVGSGRPSTKSMEEYRASVPIPCKLFDKQGKFISNIGAIGQGPGEYNLIYSMQLDEKNQRVYLAPWQTDKILVYDLQGNVLEPIRMPYRAPKATFKVDGDRVAVAIIPFGNKPSVAWIQTVGGDVLYEIPSAHFAVQDFSNEVMSMQNTADMDMSFWNYPSRVDSIYHIDMQTGKLIPRFTADFKTETPDNHTYSEWPNYFLGNTSSFVTIMDGNGVRQEGKRPAYYIVDKKTLKGAFIRIENDYLGGQSVENPLYLFNKGYYSRNIEPGKLEEWIDEILLSNKLDAKMRTKLTDLKNSIDENDNNYIVYAKQKI